MEHLLIRAQTIIALYGLNLIAALLIFLIGRWIAKLVRRVLDHIMTRRNVDPTLRGFINHLVYMGLLAFVIIAAFGKLGIQTASFVAVLGAAGLAVGLALQGSLANFAAGVLLIIFKPYRVGDFIEGGGASGTVEEVQLFSTQLKTVDNKTIIIPNSKISSDNIVNYSAKPTRRVDMTFGVGYNDDIEQVKAIISGILAQDKRILPEPAPQIAVSELADSSVNFIVRPWVKSSDHWPVYFDITEAVKKKFDIEGISIPFPQRDIHLFEHKE
ncbi:mechanosensitive ion channel domain-containing protein [Desulfobacterota bacterium M19]